MLFKGSFCKTITIELSKKKFSKQIGLKNQKMFVIALRAFIAMQIAF